MWKLHLLVVLALVVGACGTSDSGADDVESTTASTTSTTIGPTTTAATASPSATENSEAVLLDLTFDGESCTFDGPTELTQGPIVLTFHNESDVDAAVNFLELLEGKTIEDVIEYNGPEPTQRHHPSWSRELGSWSRVSAGSSHEWEAYLEPASYFMVCAQLAPPISVWLGTGLTVVG